MKIVYGNGKIIVNGVPLDGSAFVVEPDPSNQRDVCKCQPVFEWRNLRVPFESILIMEKFHRGLCPMTPKTADFTVHMKRGPAWP